MLGFYRLILAFGVLLTHTKLLPDMTSRSMVSAFFVLSGYLMALTLNRNYAGDKKAYYWNRVLRIFPLHILISLYILASFPLFVNEQYVWFFGHYHIPGSAWYVLFSLFLIPNFAPFLNKPAWTLSFEMTYYLLAPFIMSAGWIGTGLYTLLGVSIFATQAPLREILQPFSYNYGDHGDHLLMQFSASILYFGIGASFYLFRQRFIRYASRERRGFLLQIGSIAGLLLILCATSIYIPDLGIHFHLKRLCKALMDFQRQEGTYVNLATVLFTLCILWGWNGKEGKWSKWAGDLCYPVYLIHFVFADYFWDTDDTRAFVYAWAAQWQFIPHAQFLVRSIVATIPTMGCSILWLLLEKKLLHKFRALHTHPSRHQATPAPVPEKILEPAFGG